MTPPKTVARVFLRISIALVLLVAAVLAALWLKPPDILRIGANYAAKIVCSNVFLAGRDADEVSRSDVQAPGIALLRLVRVSVDTQRRIVRAGFLGFIGGGLAVARPGTGCAVVPDGDHVATRAALDQILADDALAGPGIRAIVVVEHGHIVAERYAAGFTVATPLLGWSMTKTVVAGLVGLLVKEGRLSLDQSIGEFPPPAAAPAAAPATAAAAPADGRERIRLADLLAMSSGLRFNEGYGAVSDVTRMLYLETNMAAFARAKPLLYPPGSVWSYSSGTANIVSRIVQDAAGRLAAAYPRERLFKPLGMSSATIETDAYGTLVGSSYMYATARDWARYAQFLLQEGVWHGHEMLPRGYVAMMAEPVAASRGEYGHGFVWLSASDAAVSPGKKNPNAAFSIPADTFWMSGHDGQSIAVIRSRDMAIVRLGLTPARYGYQPQPLVKALLDAIQ